MSAKPGYKINVAFGSECTCGRLKMVDGGIEYASDRPEEILRIDWNNDTDLSEYAVLAFNNTNRFTIFQNPMDEEKLFNFISTLMHFLFENDPCCTLKQRSTFYKEISGPKLLGKCYSSKMIMCREKAIMLHILLADCGIPSEVAFGTRSDDKNTRHAWVICRKERFRYSLSDSLLIDPSFDLIGRGPDFLNYSPYTVDVESFAFVEPLLIFEPNKPATRSNVKWD